MPSARYYREQAQLLRTWALAAADHDQSTQLTARAIDLLTRSMNSDGASGIDLDQAIMEFNHAGETAPRPRCGPTWGNA